ncbi:hypothetical protein B0H17DRAFT_1147695 [Mycena rosella]|uniref:Uncharacterized protein n=1 Tax=Mycena rosella TaxID=1033263 RepID=A0AAD7CIA7_MYCRO|nr:hypothetical protein B0H17DRAFT_1147695 [Mycena rosella]
MIPPHFPGCVPPDGSSFDSVLWHFNYTSGVYYSRLHRPEGRLGLRADPTPGTAVVSTGIERANPSRRRPVMGSGKICTGRDRRQDGRRRVDGIPENLLHRIASKTEALLDHHQNSDDIRLETCPSEGNAPEKRRQSLKMGISNFDKIIDSHQGSSGCQGRGGRGYENLRRPERRSPRNAMYAGSADDELLMDAPRCLSAFRTILPDKYRFAAR